MRKTWLECLSGAEYEYAIKKKKGKGEKIKKKFSLGVTRTHDLRIMRPTLYRLSYQSFLDKVF